MSLRTHLLGAAATAGELPRVDARRGRSDRKHTVAGSQFVRAEVTMHGPVHFRSVRLLLACVVLVVLAAPVALAGRSGKLPPGTLRGNEHLLDEYPTVALATDAQRTTAVRLLKEIRTAAQKWPTLERAAAAGFDTHTARRRAGDKSVHYLHAESHRNSHDAHYLDPQRPEALIYANVPGRPLVLVGLMFAMPRGR